MNETKLVWYVKDLETGKPCPPKQIFYQFNESIYQILSPSEVFETQDEAREAYIKAEMARIAQLRTALRQAEIALDAYIGPFDGTKRNNEDSPSK